MTDYAKLEMAARELVVQNNIAAYDGAYQCAWDNLREALDAPAEALPTCKRCDKPPAYPGAAYCGAACVAKRRVKS